LIRKLLLQLLRALNAEAQQQFIAEVTPAATLSVSPARRLAVTG